MAQYSRRGTDEGNIERVSHLTDTVIWVERGTLSALYSHYNDSVMTSEQYLK
jgi:hypothetical protein